MSDLEELFRRHVDPVHTYAQRHVGPDCADDVVSETLSWLGGAALTFLPSRSVAARGGPQRDQQPAADRPAS